MIIERAIRQSQQTNQRMIPFFLLYTDFFRFFYLSFFSFSIRDQMIYSKKVVRCTRSRTLLYTFVYV